jgi:hypothetical protein
MNVSQTTDWTDATDLILIFKRVNEKIQRKSVASVKSVVYIVQKLTKPSRTIANEKNLLCYPHINYKSNPFNCPRNTASGGYLSPTNAVGYCAFRNLY